ncbi:acyl-CoA synthetase family protein [Haloquadratum walsbyi]|uniref:Uncharacterized protein n=1 Tax=Haloquadratum walsbyi (strain DSM 16854 / JCM 12705 / C23) TaxID=768065 RepID=G0LLG0_HALWC|nr:acetyl-CoA synthetase [Haloquadratum walsbyi]CCC40766.1 uncharacterized protein Hqrw_2968 [Haloquadratum walsbyi C23]
MNNNPGDLSESDTIDDDPPARVTDPAIIGDIMDRNRRNGTIALRADAADRYYTYRDFITTSYKSGNVIRYLGGRSGDEMLLVPDPLPEPVLAFYGAAQLGIATRFDKTVQLNHSTEELPRVVLAPSTQEEAYELPPGHNLAVYGDSPTETETTHWETEVWSENPAIHPTSVAPSDIALNADKQTYTHEELITAAVRVVDRVNITPGADVVVRESLMNPHVVVAGLIAPLLAGATIVFPDETTTGEIGVSTDTVPEPKQIDLNSIW